MWVEKSLPNTCILAINSIKKRLKIGHLHYTAILKKENWKITRTEPGDYFRFKDYFSEYISEGIKKQVRELVCVNWILGIHTNNSFIVRRWKKKLYIITVDTKFSYDSQDLPSTVMNVWFQNDWNYFLTVMRELIFKYYDTLSSFQDAVKKIVSRLCPEFPWWPVKMYERLYNALA